MKERLLTIIRCPQCKTGSFSLENNAAGQPEVTGGRVVCRSCKAFYRIEGGIVDFLNNATEGVERERKAMDEDEYITDADGKKYRITDDSIRKFKTVFLSLPRGDGSHFFKKGGSFQNIAEASERFYSALNGLALTGKENVLEIGACFSYGAFEFAKKGCNTVALDISNYLKVSNLFTERAYFDRIFSDVHNMPFMDGVFDIVFGSAVLHHSKDLARAFREIRRVLKPGGKLVLINESARGIFERVHPVFKEMHDKGFGDTSYSIPQWKKGAIRAGFRKIKIDFLSTVDDYITKHKNRGTEPNFKLKTAYFIKRHRKSERFLTSLSIAPRLFFRPKSWKLVCYK